ncbi:hypothetical protein MC885_011967 [Smutsia gigantea]|nr:hypothetical protein MC885_011967 [Smutsia gigantea]
MSGPAQPQRDLKLRLHNLWGKFLARTWNKGNRWKMKMTARLLRIALALLFLGLTGVLEATTISCRNEEGEAVDWYTQNNKTAYLIYNDGAPKSVNYSRKHGHTKGILLWNRVQGFWLIHSIPRFPPTPEEGYDYPPTGRRNGQTGICITFKYNQYETIDSQLLICNPNVYSCSVPATFHQELVHMSQLCTRSSSAEIPGRHLTTLQSAQGQNFLHFAKSDSFLDDIFSAWMAQQLKTHLLTETWQRKKQELPSNCSLPYHVYNVKAIKISGKSYFSSYQDHAKWCISKKGTKNRWTCIGDLNRSPYQAFRSGGFICTQNQNIYQAFQGLVLYYENCN